MGFVVRVVRMGKSYYIHIPKPVYQMVGEPQAFELEVRDGYIVIKPVRG
jgi:antitoxin component of MazEF toxin-antitoxin module